MRNANERGFSAHGAHRIKQRNPFSNSDGRAVFRVRAVRIVGYATGLFLLVVAGFVSCGRNGEGDGINGTGSIEVREVRISPLIPGRIKAIHVSEGDPIHTGELLVTLVADEVHADVDFNRAAREGAKRSVEQAQAVYRNAKEEMERAKKLHDAGIVSKQDLDRAVTQYRVTLAAFKSAKARVKQGEAAFSRASTRLSETLLSSPLTGVVLSKNFEEGEVVLPGSAILSVADLDETYLRIYVSTEDLAGVRLGQNASVTIDGVDEPFSARVVHIADHSEFTPKNVQTKEARTRLVFGVKLRVDNRDLILKPGMPAEAILLNRPEHDEQKGTQGGERAAKGAQNGVTDSRSSDAHGAKTGGEK